MKNIEIHYEGENLHIKIPQGMTDEHGNLLIEHVEEALQGFGILEINEINPDFNEFGGFWLDGDSKNIYFWNDQVTSDLKNKQEAVLIPHGKLSKFVDINKQEHREFLLWLYGEPIEDAIKQMHEDCNIN